MESLRLTIIYLNPLLKRFSFKQRTFIQSFFSLFISLVVDLRWRVCLLSVVEGFSVSLNELQIFFVIFGFTALLYNVLYFSNDYLFRRKHSVSRT